MKIRSAPYRTFLENLSFLFCVLLIFCDSTYASTTLVVALDSSGSLDKGADRSKICVVSALRAASELEPGDKLVIVEINDDSYAVKHPLFEKDFLVRSSNPLHVKVGRDLFQEEIDSTLNLWLKTSSKRTKIVDAFFWVSEYFSFSKAGKKRLLVCSDGIEDSAIADMEKGVRTGLLDKMVRDKIVPLSSGGLHNVEVMWVGLGGKKEVKHINAIKEFWISYFDRTGAKLVRMGRPGL